MKALIEVLKLNVADVITTSVKDDCIDDTTTGDVCDDD